jgi:hypothetical protein
VSSQILWQIRLPANQFVKKAGWRTWKIWCCTDSDQPESCNVSLVPLSCWVLYRFSPCETSRPSAPDRDQQYSVIAF